MASPERVSSQQLVSIDTITDGIIVLRSKALRAILQVEGINFDLKGPDEQQGIVSAFQDFLTSLDFTLQIAIRSRSVNLDPYLNGILARRENEPNDLLKAQMTEYANFLDTFVRDYHIMRKLFFVVIPYQQTTAAKLGIPFTPGATAPGAPASSEEEFSRSRAQLETRINIVSSGLSRMGLENHLLTTEELVKYFYSFYNPQDADAAE
jgi:hypothetical protein